ncbi:ATP-binding protein [Natrinema salinisoli]|uniref:ATP-binding protein n=1 Tax=Natrinema salinisoli TaxID=2878535 RepID=UPI001CF0BCEC|nr:hypothetical protein [Natrinema salinisoli]
MPTEKDATPIPEEPTTASLENSSSTTARDETSSDSSPQINDDTTGVLTDSQSHELRTYIEIRPSTNPLNATAVSQATSLLYESLRELSHSSVWSTLRTRTQKPIVEWLLVADGHSDASIRYLVGTTHDPFLSELEAILRTWFPDTYELRRVEWHPRQIEASRSIPTENERSSSSTVGDCETRTCREQPYVTGVEYRATAEVRRDWQTSLATFDEITDRSSQRRSDEDESKSRRVPIATLVETLCDSAVPIVYQVVCCPIGDQRADAEQYRYDLERSLVTPADRFFEFVFPKADEKPDPRHLSPSYRDRLADLETRDLRRTFCLSARAVAFADERDREHADAIVHSLASVFGHLSGPFHTVRGHVTTDSNLHTGTLPPGSRLFVAIRERTCPEPTYDSLETRLPWKTHESAGIVVSPEELPGFCLIDGVGLTPTGQRALGARQSERTGLPLPSPTDLERYTGTGQALCMPLTDDRQPYENSFVLPPSLQDRHLFVVGDTGSGKSVLTAGAMLSNLEATDGPEILFDYKGGGTAEEYLRAHYAEHGDLENVRYFDLTKLLPALSIFDIRSLLDAGLSREEARSRIAGHYEEILAGLMGEEQYYGATESTKAIRNHLRALFDPIHGSETVSHKDLYRALQRTLSDRTPPPTSDDRLTEYFAGLLERDRDVFNKVLGGAVARVEIIATDDRLAPLFDHVHTLPESDDRNENGDHETLEDSSPHFDFIDAINDDVVIIFDFGGMEERIKRALTLVLLSNLWTALKARSKSPEMAENPLLVNLYLEEAKDVVATQLVDTLLSQGRSFGLSLMLGVQFPSQLDSPDPSNHTYEEALNEIGTFIVGNVSIEDDLAKALATDTIPPKHVARRLAAIRHGEWLVRPAAEFGSPVPRPFLGRSLPAPDGHPVSETPLDDERSQAFETVFELTALETWKEFGLSHEIHPSRSDTAGGENGADDVDDDPREEILRVDSLLPHTRRLPDCVSYDESVHALCCGSCENRYDPTIEGMKRAIECCHTLTDVDSDDIPVCDVNLKLTPEERDVSEWSDRQLLFLQTVYNAQQLRYDPLEYALLQDSMIRLQEYVGIETDEIAPLLDADLLRHDTDHPHRLYSVSSEGRSAIGESYRKGVDYGHGVGDLDESSEHVFGIEVTRQYLEEAYAANPQSDVTEVIPYYELDDQHRLDLAGVSDDGEIIVTAEVERINHDIGRAVPDDFDKMAACDPEAAIWVVMKQADGHRLLSALNDPLEGDPRVEKTYAKTTPPQQFRIDTPGMTAVYPAEWLRDHSPEP